MIKLSLCVSDTVHANEHISHVSCGLHVNLWKLWLMLFCFMMKKDYFKQNLLFWPRVPFKDSMLTLDHISFSFVEETSSQSWLVRSFRNSREGNRDPEMPFLFFRIRFCCITSPQQFYLYTFSLKLSWR